MVLRQDEHATEEFNIKIGDKWVHISRELLAIHPGGSAITTYKNLDATTVFHTFHANSKIAYKMLQATVKAQEEKNDGRQDNSTEKCRAPATASCDSTLAEQHSIDSNNNETNSSRANLGKWEMGEEESRRINREFDSLRLHVRELGLLNSRTSFFVRKFCEASFIIGLSLLLQSRTFYCLSALCMLKTSIKGLAWQQLGWMIHEYCHHQHFKNHFWNDLASYVVGNLMQGFSSGGWKEQHNTHHAATNVVGRDGDIDLMPLWATVPSDLDVGEEPQRIDYGEGGYSPSLYSGSNVYRHLYWAVGLPFLRLSWLVQSIGFVASMDKSFYEIHRKRARVEQLTLLLHYVLVSIQYYYLPDIYTRVSYFLLSQLFAGFLIAHVVTYNHYSTDKFEHDAQIMSNYCCLQLHTTRNMRSGPFIDWLWGGLNYQIEHHLFPTMPRNNLGRVAPLVKAFCERNHLPYMTDDYSTGWAYEIEQFRRIAQLAAAKLVTQSR